MTFSRFWWKRVIEGFSEDLSKCYGPARLPALITSENGECNRLSSMSDLQGREDFNFRFDQRTERKIETKQRRYIVKGRHHGAGCFLEWFWVDKLLTVKVAVVVGERDGCGEDLVSNGWIRGLDDNFETVSCSALLRAIVSIQHQFFQFISNAWWGFMTLSEAWLENGWLDRSRMHKACA